MVRGRRQNPDAPPSRQLEISRAFRKRKANDIQSLRDRADRIERENADLRRENERLRLLLKRPPTSRNTSAQLEYPINDHRNFHTGSENDYTSLYHSTHDRTNSMPSTSSRREEELMQNIQHQWSLQSGFDQLSHTPGSTYNYAMHATSATGSEGTMNEPHINQQHHNQSLGDVLAHRHDSSLLRLSAGPTGVSSRDSAVSHQSHPSVTSPQSSNTQTFQVMDLRPGAQMRMMDNVHQSGPTDGGGSEQQQQGGERVRNEQHHGTPSFNQTTYRDLSTMQHHQIPLSTTNDQDSAQRLWDLAVRANGGDTSKCCVGLFECDEQGRIKVETPPHIAYPA